MLAKNILCGILLLLAGACATAGQPNQGSTSSYEGVAAMLLNAVTTYQALEARLTAEQKQEFKEAYDQLCKSYQTSGILLEAAVDADDQASAHTAIISYQRTVVQLPGMAGKVSQLVQGFKTGK